MPKSRTVYPDAPEISGVYIMTNITNGHFYVGSSSNLRERWLAHRTSLKGGRHDNSRLQAAWDEYGESYFRFDVLEFVDNPDSLFEREQFWLDTHDAGKRDDCYNISSYADSTRGTVRSAEARERMSEVQKKVVSPARQASSGVTITRYNISKRGVPHSEEHRQKIANAKKGQKHSAESRKLMSEAGMRQSEQRRQRMLGVKRSEETKQRLSVAASQRTGERNHRSRRIEQLDRQGHHIEFFVNLTAAEKATGISHQSISVCLRGIRDDAGGYLWKYADGEKPPRP